MKDIARTVMAIGTSARNQAPPPRPPVQSAAERHNWNWRRRSSWHSWACRCGREAMTVFLVLIPRMDKRINRTDLCMHARSSFPLTCSDTLDLCTLSCLCRSNRPDLCEVYATLLLLRLLLVRASFSCIHQYSCSFIHYANLVHGSRRITQCL